MHAKGQIFCIINIGTYTKNKLSEIQDNLDAKNMIPNHTQLLAKLFALFRIKHHVLSGQI